MGTDPRIKRGHFASPSRVAGGSSGGSRKPVKCWFLDFKNLGSFIRPLFFGWRGCRLSDLTIIDILEQGSI